MSDHTAYNDSVFINCPFDDIYQNLFLSIVFTVLDCGFIPRCALEERDSSTVRINKIKKIISECKYGIHDLSRTELDSTHQLPRFNMPFELGLFMGAKYFGTKPQKQKTCLILDVERFRCQKFLSDIAGQDIEEHAGKSPRAIEAVRSFLVSESGRTGIPGGAHINTRFNHFMKHLPDAAKQASLDIQEAKQFKEFAVFAREWATKDSLSVEAGSLS